LTSDNCQQAKELLENFQRIKQLEQEIEKISKDKKLFDKSKEEISSLK
jgi:hypothetical protein